MRSRQRVRRTMTSDKEFQKRRSSYRCFVASWTTPTAPRIFHMIANINRRGDRAKIPLSPPLLARNRRRPNKKKKKKKEKRKRMSKIIPERNRRRKRIRRNDPGNARFRGSESRSSSTKHVCRGPRGFSNEASSARRSTKRDEKEGTSLNSGRRN